jgi:hypothetical protein
MTNPLLAAALPTLITEIGQGIRQHLEYHRQQKAIKDQSARIDALEAKVSDLGKAHDRMMGDGK